LDKQLQDIYDGWYISQEEWTRAREELDIAERALIQPLKDGIAIIGINPPLHLIEKVESLRNKLFVIAQEKDLWIKKLKDE